MSDENIRKYLPRLEDILRRTDEGEAKRKLDEALNNPELDRALADLNKEPTGGEAPPLEAPARTDSAGPWHEAPEAATRQAHGAAAAQAKPPRVRAKRKGPSALTMLLALLAVSAPAVLVAFFRPAGRDSTPDRPAASEAALQDASVEQVQMPLVLDAGQGAAAEAAHEAGPERQTPEPAPSGSATLTPSTSGAPPKPPGPGPSALPQKASDTPKRPPDSNIPEQFF